MPRVDAEWLDPRRYPFRHEATTRFGDVDNNEHINNVAMASAFEDARIRFGGFVGLARGGETRTVIASNDIAFLAEAYYPAPLNIFVGVARIGRTSWTAAALLMQDSQVCAFARTVLVSMNDGKPHALDEAWRLKLESGLLSSVDGADR